MHPKIASLPVIDAEAELIVLPYASTKGLSIVERLIMELPSGDWTVFRCALAFGKQSGNFPALVDAMRTFLESGGRLSITFGADTFAGNTKGSDFAAIQELLIALGNFPNFELHLYHENGRTFHPKLLFFENHQTERGLVIVGSSNWSEGGLFRNVEANVALHLDYTRAGHLEYRNAINELLDEYWGEG